MAAQGRAHTTVAGVCLRCLADLLPGSGPEVFDDARRSTPHPPAHSTAFPPIPLQIDCYIDRASAWWGVSVKMGSTGGLALFLGAFSFITQGAWVAGVAGVGAPSLPVRCPSPPAGSPNHSKCPTHPCPLNPLTTEMGFPALTSFTTRLSLAGKLTGNGLPIGVGE